MPTNEIELNEDGEFYPIGEHPQEVWDRLELLHWAKMSGRHATTAVMQYETVGLAVLMKTPAPQIREFFGEWDGNPNQ